MTLISALTAVTTPALADEYEIEQAGASFKITGTQIMNLLAANISLDAARITAGTLAVARGGTGIASYTIGDLLYASGATALSALAGVATGNVLLSGGVATAPAWGKVDVTAAITGIVPSANGGTGVNNAGTITNASNTVITGGGTLALGGFTGTLPATGTFDLIGTAQTITAVKTHAITDAATNTTTVPLIVGHNSSGTAAASFGVGLKMTLESSTTDDQDAAQIEARWTTATHASRSSKLDLSVVQSAGALTSRMTVNDGANAAGVYIPWISGDSLCSLFVGSANASNNQIAIQGQTASNVGVYGYASAANGTGLKGESGSGIGLSTTVSNSAGTSSLFESTAALTTTVHTAFLKRGNSSGTPAAGYGLTSQTQLKSSTTTNQAALDETVTWSTATHASRKARVVWSIYDTASREVLRGEASGTAAMIGFLGANAAVRQASGADLTNNVTSGGTDNTIADFTDLTVYATDAATIRNDIYQLARKLKQVNDALRLYGLLT